MFQAFNNLDYESNDLQKLSLRTSDNVYVHWTIRKSLHALYTIYVYNMLCCQLYSLLNTTPIRSGAAIQFVRRKILGRGTVVLPLLIEKQIGRRINHIYI